MPTVVRSDYTLATYIADDKGARTRLAIHTTRGHAAMEGNEVGVTHLHRVSPDGSTLATLTGSGRNLDVTDLATGDTRRVKVVGTHAKPRQFRWLPDNRTVAISDGSEVMLVTIPDAAESSAELRSVFGEASAPALKKIHDVRSVPQGLLVQGSIQGTNWDEDLDRHAYLVQTSGADVSRIVDLTPPGLEIQNATPRDGGRIVLSVWDEDGNHGSEGEDVPPLWTVWVDEHGKVRVDERRTCVVDYCNVNNWAPGSSRIAYNAWAPTAYVEDGLGWKAFSLRGEDDDDGWMPMSELWINKAETHLVGADTGRVRLWTLDGVEQWTFEPPKKETIHSVHFDPDGVTVWLGAGLSIYRVDPQGSATRVVKAVAPPIPGSSRRGRKNKKNGKTSRKAKPFIMPMGSLQEREAAFVDDVVPLGNGRVAYMVVALHAKPLGFQESERLMEAGKVEMHGMEMW